MGVLDNIKDKLGFAGEKQEDRYDESYYDEEAYGEGYDSEYGGEYDESYDDYSSSSRGARQGGSSSGSGGPRLVSIDDVRAHTQVPDNLSRDPLPPRRNGGAQGADAYSSATKPLQSDRYRKVERAADYMKSSESSDLAPQNGGSRSPGYESMFAPTSQAAASRAQADSSSSSRSFDPYETYSGSGVTSHNPSRSLSVIKPLSYTEVEKVAKILKAGDVVVLALANTQDHLAKRILDFSFGVSSALDASVECIADKVFVINRGRALSDGEKREALMKA